LPTVLASVPTRRSADLKRELAAYFSSPLAYVFIVIFLLLCGFFTFFVGGFFEIGQASLSQPFFMWHPWFYLFLVPAVGMRLWARSEEHTSELQSPDHLV